jgi:hypothetical protein
MADVFAVFGTLLALGIAFPGLLTTFWLLFPARVDLASARLQKTPWSCIWMGFASLFLAAMPAFALLAMPISFAKLAGSVLIFLTLCFAAIGGAGIASLMGMRITSQGREGVPSLAAFIKGAVALELAAVFPVLGWFVILPLALVASMGAASFAFLRWGPRGVPAQSEPIPSQA